MIFLKTNKKTSISDLKTAVNSFLASDDIFRLLITFPNNLDPDQNIGPDLDPNCLAL